MLTYGMKKCGPLPRCDMTSIFTCLDVVDIDFDGNKEILIGTSVEVCSSIICIKLDKSCIDMHKGILNLRGIY